MTSNSNNSAPYLLGPDERTFSLERKFLKPLPDSPKQCFICQRKNDGDTFFITALVLGKTTHTCQFCIADMAFTLLQYQFKR